MLIILDGLGLNPIKKGNPLMETKTPTLDSLVKNCPHLALAASSEAVGLSWGEVGNSEVGHSNIGTGEIQWQDLPRIDQTVKDGKFKKNPVIKKACEHAKKSGSALHLLGLVSDGGVHSHISHLFALLEIAKEYGVEDVFIHVFSDGRDTPPKVAKRYLEDLEKKTKELGLGKISTVSGRFYAMDRDNHWERIEKVYNAMTGEETKTAKSAVSAVEQAYDEGQNDENIEPTIIACGSKNQFLKKNDAVIFFNFRADRARQITLAIADPKFSDFERKKKLKGIYFATMTPYETDWDIKVHTIFKLIEYRNPLASQIEKGNLAQLHIAETEKYAHVTYFFNGGEEKVKKGEKHVNIPSPRLTSYDKKPEMSIYEVTSTLLAEISKEDFGFVVVNYANPDMVGHTGNFKAAKKAIAEVDKNLDYLLSKSLKLNFAIFVTADHGNVEQMMNLETKEIDKEHTTNPVPFFWVKEYQGRKEVEITEHQKIWEELASIQPQGVLADIPPTIAELLEIERSEAFSGESLLSTLE